MPHHWEQKREVGIVLLRAKYFTYPEKKTSS